MAYTPTEWECGDRVTAEKLNAMERGIANMNGEYVPNVWECGDTITADKLNHMEQGIANGGGGSSDFSTATMTVTSQLQDWGISIVVPVACNDDETLGTCMYSDWSISVVDNPTPFQVVLYKGEAKASLYNNEGYTISVSGDATYDGDIALTITGDCTITVS